MYRLEKRLVAELLVARPKPIRPTKIRVFLWQIIAPNAPSEQEASSEGAVVVCPVSLVENGLSTEYLLSCGG